ncbi:MAG: thymidylate synthase ThyX [Candidatus Nanoarchaeia archaeon]|nr:thymidylate synthase ThyX [Candidatus Nanoarchaeia archaeon]
MLKIDNIDVLTRWTMVIDAAKTTIGKIASKKEPTSHWKKMILLAEHSPIRILLVKWKWVEIKYWVSVHFVRHKIGIEHFVKSQRSDRTGNNRENSPQNSLVDHECVANAQSIINISRKRLCNKASKETREAWQIFLDNLKLTEPELVSVCVKECLYRGHCYEFDSCGYVNTEDYAIELNNYRSL